MYVQSNLNFEKELNGKKNAYKLNKVIILV